MKRLRLGTVLLFAYFPALTHAVENYLYYIEAQSVQGYTGNIFTPSPRALDTNVWSFGLHRFMVGINYGLLPHLETGIGFDLKEMSPLFPLDQENIERKAKEISIHSKYQLFREKEHPFDLAVGQRRNRWFLSAGKFLPTVWDTTFQGGLIWEHNRLLSFFAINQTKASRQMLIDYDPTLERYNVGLRFLIAPEVKLDFFIVDVTRIKNLFFDNFIFGLTVAG